MLVRGGSKVITSIFEKEVTIGNMARDSCRQNNFFFFFSFLVLFFSWLNIAILLLSYGGLFVHGAIPIELNKVESARFSPLKFRFPPPKKDYVIIDIPGDEGDGNFVEGTAMEVAQARFQDDSPFVKGITMETAHLQRALRHSVTSLFSFVSTAFIHFCGFSKRRNITNRNVLYIVVFTALSLLLYGLEKMIIWQLRYA